MTPHEAFQQFCTKHGIEPTEDRFVCWVGALHYMWQTAVPVAYAPVVAGVPVGVLDAIRPGMNNTVPLYAAPIPDIQKPIPNTATLDFAWKNYEGDYLAFAEWLWKTYSNA